MYYTDAHEYFRLVEDGSIARASANDARDLKFSDVIWAKYGTAKKGGLWDTLKCPGCQEAPCACPRNLKITWAGTRRDKVVATSSTTGADHETTRPQVAASSTVQPAPQVIVNAFAIATPVQSFHEERITSMGDLNMPKGVNVGVGSHATGTVHGLQQLWNEHGQGEIDLPALAGDLSRLRSSLRSEATEPEHDVALAEVAKAEVAAKAGDGPGALEHLRGSGKWALDVATRIGAAVAAAAIAVATGITPGA